MKLLDIGDRGIAIVVEGATPEERMARVLGLGEAIEAGAVAGVSDVVPSPGRVTVVYDPLVVEHAAVRRGIEAAIARGPDPAPACTATRHEIPVCYGGEFGPDLDEVAAAHVLDRDQLVALHTGPEYLVEAIGFLPGFAYLAGLPESLVTPRRATPRRVVPAGSVGIGGGQTGAYPCASPGGWNLIGTTASRLFDAGRARPALLAVGDRVQFREIARAEHERLATVAVADVAMRPAPDRGMTVLTPGLFSTVQDLGRPGYRSSGVPLSGAADPASLRLANRLVGNPDTAAGLEITLLGPDLAFSCDAVVAVTGASFPGIEGSRAVAVRAGATLRLGHATTGCRGFLAVAGGVAVPSVLGSASTFVPARLGGLRGLPLAAGDVVPIGPPADSPWPEAMPAAAAAGRDAGITLRMIPGEQWSMCGPAIWSATHTVSSRSDRMGVRLEGDPLAVGGDPAGSLPSVAVLPGTVQLPPDGRPIILLADAQTIGGYPVIGHVIAADLPRVAQLRPGAAVRWAETTIADAHRALREAAAAWSPPR